VKERAALRDGDVSMKQQVRDAVKRCHQQQYQNHINSKMLNVANISSRHSTHGESIRRENNVV